MKGKKKWLMCLAFMLMLSLIPAQAFAAGKVYTKGGTYYVRDDTGKTGKFTGFVKKGNYKYYIKNGKRSKYTGFVKSGKSSYYVVKGVKSKKTGFVTSSRYYVTNGKKSTVTGFVKVGKDKYYLIRGRNIPWTGLRSTKTGTYYVYEGKLKNFTGVVRRQYVKNGKVTSYTGLVKSGNSRYYVEDGKASKINGVKKIGDTSYYFTYGKVSDKTGLIQIKTNDWVFHDNEQGLQVGIKYYEQYVKNGVLTNYTGIISDGDDRYYVKNGRRNYLYGILKLNGKEYPLTEGKLSNVTGVDKICGTPYFLKKGEKLNVTGVYKDNVSGRLVYVKDGVWQPCACGTVTYDGKTYSVKDGTATLLSADAEDSLSYDHSWEVYDTTTHGYDFCNYCGSYIDGSYTAHVDAYGKTSILVGENEDGSPHYVSTYIHGAGTHGCYVITDVVYRCSKCGEKRNMQTDLSRMYSMYNGKEDYLNKKYNLNIKEPEFEVVNGTGMTMGDKNEITLDGTIVTIDDYLNKYLVKEIKN